MGQTLPQSLRRNQPADTSDLRLLVSGVKEYFSWVSSPAPALELGLGFTSQTAEFQRLTLAAPGSEFSGDTGFGRRVSLETPPGSPTGRDCPASAFRADQPPRGMPAACEAPAYTAGCPLLVLAFVPPSPPHRVLPGQSFIEGSAVCGVLCLALVLARGTRFLLP